MSTHGSGSPSPATAASAAAVDTSSHWAPHGPVLTACVVGINVLVILLIFFFFWRFFSGRRDQSASAGAEDNDDDTLPVASPWAPRRGRGALRTKPQEDVAPPTLPVYVYSSAGAGGGKAAECAVCIVELRDGDAARLLPLCGHRFHADCVGTWLRLHATCPLCRAGVVAPAAADADKSRNPPKDGVGADFSV